jgi:iron complex transport system substrate-binding protein
VPVTGSRYEKGLRIALGALSVGLFALPARTAALPERVISLAPSITETIFALGLGDRLVGVSVYCDHPPEAKRIDRVGTFLVPSVETILAKRPNVVLAVPSPGNQSSVDTLRRLGLKVVVLDPNTVAEIKEAIVTVARELEVEEKGRTLVSQIEGRMNQIRARLAGVVERKVLMVVGQTPLIAVGAPTFQDELIRMAGGVNVAAGAGNPWPHLTLEFAITAAPDVIVDTTMGNEERVGAEAALNFWSAFPTIPAVRAQRVFGYQAYQLLRPGPRLADALEALARFIHPERFLEAVRPGRGLPGDQGGPR